jgi:hypothetical protein
MKIRHPEGAKRPRDLVREWLEPPSGKVPRFARDDDQGTAVGGEGCWRAP